MIPVALDRLVPLLLIWAAAIYVYLAVLKPTPIRTVGYWIAGTKIVTLRGERPSTLRMSLRLMIWILGPFNFLIDLGWLGIDPDKQTMRDCLAGTCVVRNKAQPAGTGEIHLVRYHVAGLNLMYPRVIRRSE
jgi:uncharacterized RDD family membrane protein YckC